MQDDDFWRQASLVFHERASEYDGWFEESLLFDIELAAVRQLGTPLAGPKLEVGVGPGRFAEGLEVDFGLDPAFAPLRFAQKRSVQVCQAVGEALPLREQSLGTIFLLFTLCFLGEPQVTLAECRRVLRADGHLVLGTIVADSPWGMMLQQKKAEGHPFYRHARFYDPGEVERWLANLGFRVVERRSSLRQAPQDLKGYEASRAGLAPDAGFAIIVARKTFCAN